MRFLIALLLSVSAWAQLGPMLPDGIPFAGGGGGGSPPALAQNQWDCGGYATNPSCTATSGSNATSGNILIAYMWASAAGGTFATPTGCASSWTLVNFDSTSVQAFYIGTVASTASCAVAEVASSSGNSVLTLVISELSNAIATADVYGYTASLGNCSSCTGTSVTTTVANDFVLTYTQNCTGTITVSAPYTLGISNNPVGNPTFSAYNVAASTGATAASWTATGGCEQNASIAVKP